MARRYWLKRALVFAMKRLSHPPVQALLRAAVRRHDGTRIVVCGANNRVTADGASLERVSVSVVGDDNAVSIADGAILVRCRIRMAGSGHRLIIGANCHLVDADLAFEDTACTITIGTGTTIEGGHLAAVEPGSSVTLGDDCMLSDGIDIRTSDSHAIFDSASGRRLNPPADVSLGRHVWLGTQVAVLKGVTIGDGAVIGARSVVTSDVPAGCIAAGVPARVLREGVTWTRERASADGLARPTPIGAAKPAD
ncbi:Galactoside O-acetyltransferase [compost metagenome]